VPESFEAVRNLGGGSVSICFLPYAGIKGLVESGFGYSILPQHALLGRNRFFQTYRIAGHRLTRSLALAMVRTDYPHKLRQAVADFLQRLLYHPGLGCRAQLGNFTQPGWSTFRSCHGTGGSRRAGSFDA